MSEFVYLFRNSGTPGSPQQMQEQMQRWQTWMKYLAARGHLKSRGNALERTGTIVGKDGAMTDGPFTEAKDIVGGFMVVEAEDLDHAAKLASGCPVFETGGRVEVRPVMKM